MMTYSETISWLFTLVPNYHQQGSSAYKPGLENIQAFLNHLGNPEKELKTIHIAGTNGKGSVAHILASVFQENKYKTGLFTSPHIKDFRERIKINGQLCDPDFVLEFVAENKQYITEHGITFFEICAAMAFMYFKQKDCDIAVIETGLGGRLDATNVVHPELSIITNIGLEHTQFLGDTIEEIAYEKGGIIKDGRPVVYGDNDQVVYGVLKYLSTKRRSDLYLVEQPISIDSDLKANYQQKNLNTVHRSLEILTQLGWQFNSNATKNGFLKVGNNVGFQGRFQLIEEDPRVILDVAHNAAAVNLLLKELDDIKYDQLHIVFGAANDKNLEEIFEQLPNSALYYFSSFENKRSTTIAKLGSIAEDQKFDYQSFSHVKEALRNAKMKAGNEDLILVFGSFYLLEALY